jgi:hypothetical protein
MSYLRRWRMELWLRDIKITMDMDRLRTQTPARVRAELAMSDSSGFSGDALILSQSA